MFRLAHWLAIIEDCTLFQTLFGCRFCHIRAKQLPGPLAIGSCDPLLCGLQAGSQACRTSWRAKGPPGDLLRLQGSNPWTLEQPTSRDEDRAEASRRLSLPLRENIYFRSFIYLWYRLFGKALRGWLRLVGRGTIPASPRERTAIQVCG